MKKKEKLIIVILLSLSLSTISTNVLGQTTYTCKVQVGDEFIFTLTILTAAYGETRKRVGDKDKILITDITEETDYFKIEYDIWLDISKGESFSSTADYHGWEGIYKDPTNPEAGQFGNSFVLTPVSDYLTAFAETDPYYSSSGNKLTHSIDSREWIHTYEIMDNFYYKKKELASLYHGIGTVFYYQKNYDATISLYEKALSIFEEINDKNSLSMCYYLLSNVYLLNRNFIASKFYKKQTENNLENIPPLLVLAIKKQEQKISIIKKFIILFLALCFGILILTQNILFTGLFVLGVFILIGFIWIFKHLSSKKYDLNKMIRNKLNYFNLKNLN